MCTHLLLSQCHVYDGIRLANCQYFKPNTVVSPVECVYVLLYLSWCGQGKSHDSPPSLRPFYGRIREKGDEKVMLA